MKRTWQVFNPFIEKLTGNTHNKMEEHMLTITANTQKNKHKKLILTIITTILIEIWIARNMLNFNNKLILTETIIKNIKQNLKHIIETHYKEHKLNDTLNKFKEKFCINDSLCTLNVNTNLHNI